MFFTILLGFGLTPKASCTDFNAGPLVESFSLVTQPGQRTEAFGPFYYWEVTEDDDTEAFPPFFSHIRNANTDSEQYDFIYPLLTFDRYGGEYRWQLFQLLNWTGGQKQSGAKKKRFTIFPFYFQQRSPNPEENYTALFPIYGHLEGRMFRSETDFFLWPLYIKTVRRPSASALPDDPFAAPAYQFLSIRRGDVTTRNYLYPFFHVREGEGLHGWQFWPFYSMEHKDVTFSTNVWGEVNTIPGRDARFVLWPFYFNITNGVGSDNPEHHKVLLPFYHTLRSPARDSTSILGVTVTEDRARKYRETDVLWPLFVRADGEGKKARRIWPFYSHASNEAAESGFSLWPIYKMNRLHTGPLDRKRERILFFLYSRTVEKNTETGKAKKRADFLPFYTYTRDFKGNERLQVLSVLEPLLPTNTSVERNYSPVWSIWRAEKNPNTGAASQSLLWNLYRRDITPSTKKCSLLFGLFQYSSSPDARRVRLFYIPFGGKQTEPQKTAK